MKTPTSAQRARYIRRAIVVWSVGLSGIVYTLIGIAIPAGNLQTIRLEQWYGFLAWICLYFTLLISPFSLAFSRFPWRQELFIARRALGLSVLYFALLHTCIAFWGQLDGFNGLPFLVGSYLLAVILGASALVIFLLLGASATDTAVSRLGFHRWKFLHRFVYVAGVLTLVHGLLIGTHFQDLSSALPVVCFALVSILMIMEAQRVERWIDKKWIPMRMAGPVSMIVVAAAAFWVGFSYCGGGKPSISAHAGHDGSGLGVSGLAVYDRHGNLISGGSPAIQQVNVNLSYSELRTGIPVELVLSPSDADNGMPIQDFRIVHEKLMYLIVVDDELDWFDHINPVFTPGRGFVVTETFPHAGRYRLFAEFQPSEGPSQSTVLSILIPSEGKAKGQESATSTSTPDRLTQETGGYRFTLVPDNNLSAATLNTGSQTLSVHIEKISNGSTPIIQPWLGSLGHMIIVDAQKYRFYHVGAELRPASASAGAALPFLVYSPVNTFAAGLHRVFVQIKIDGRVLLADFDITLK